MAHLWWHTETALPSPEDVFVQMDEDTAGGGLSVNAADRRFHTRPHTWQQALILANTVRVRRDKTG